MALSSFSRCPSGRPSSLRCSSLSAGKTSPSIALSENVCSYCSRPRLRSQTAMSTIFLLAPAATLLLSDELYRKPEVNGAVHLINRADGLMLLAEPEIGARKRAHGTTASRKRDPACP